MNIITIDPSLSCTSVCINGRFHVYATNNIAKTKKDMFVRWFDVMRPYVAYRTYPPINNKLPYSKLELEKLQLYNIITDDVVADIIASLTNIDNTLVCIEGYSYSSASGPLIDLVSFGSLLRLKLMRDLKPRIIIISPSTLKVKACELTYGEKFNAGGKRLPCVNCNNVAGGRFKKHEMLHSLLENDNLRDDWYINVLRSECSSIIDMTKIPKPIEDMNDAKIMYEIILNFAKNNNFNMLDIEHKLV